MVEFSNGDKLGVAGMSELVVLRRNAERPEYRPFSVEPPATSAYCITPGDDGRLWGGASFGVALFSFDPKTGESWRSLPVDGQRYSGGQVEGLAMWRGKIYLHAYTGGLHAVYDPAMPWSSQDNANPRIVHRSAPEYIRPCRWSALDDRGFFWGCWLSKYGTREMAVTRWNLATDEVVTFERVLPGQSPAHAACDGERLWFTTGGYANGMPNARGPFALVALDRDGGIAFERRFDASLQPSSVCFAGKYGVVCAGKTLYAIDADAMSLSEIPGVELKNGYIDTTAPCGGGAIAVFDREATHIVEPKERRLVMTAEAFEGALCGTVLGGEFYVADQRRPDIYRLVKGARA
jgi:hypothetical protein